MEKSNAQRAPDNPLADVPQVDARTAYEQWQRGEIGVVDIREPSEWNLGHIEGVEWIPMGQLPWKWRQLDPEKRWVCVCRSGNRQGDLLLLKQSGEKSQLDVETLNLDIRPYL